MAIAPQQHPISSTQKQPQRRRLTEDEFLRLPDDGRKYELVGGELKKCPPDLSMTFSWR